MIVSKLMPDQAYSFWDYLEPGIHEIFLKSEGTFGWRPADVLRSIKNKQSQVCFVYDGQDRVGWFIYYILLEAASHRPYLHVWLLWAEPKRRGSLSEVGKDLSAWLTKEAQDHKCKYIEMDSNRLGWMRYGKQMGFKPHRMVHRKEI